jgi:hypothetical protein
VLELNRGSDLLGRSIVFNLIERAGNTLRVDNGAATGRAECLCFLVGHETNAATTATRARGAATTSAMSKARRFKLARAGRLKTPTLRRFDGEAGPVSVIWDSAAVGDWPGEDSSTPSGRRRCVQQRIELEGKSNRAARLRKILRRPAWSQREPDGRSAFARAATIRCERTGFGRKLATLIAVARARAFVYLRRKEHDRNVEHAAEIAGTFDPIAFAAQPGAEGRSTPVRPRSKRHMTNHSTTGSLRVEPEKSQTGWPFATVTTSAGERTKGSTSRSAGPK